MEQQHNSFLVGALVAIAGVAIGAGSVLSAQLVAFSGADPNYIKDFSNWRQNAERVYSRDVNRHGEQPSVEDGAYTEAHDTNDELHNAPVDTSACDDRYSGRAVESCKARLRSGDENVLPYGGNY